MYRDRVLREIDTEDYSRIIIPYCIDLEYEKRLFLEQSYVVYCCEDETKVRLQFSSQDILELREARKLLVDVAEGLLVRLNKSPGLNSKLSPYPLTADQLEIYIDFQSYYGFYMDPFYIGWVVLEDGMAYYYAFNLKDYTHDHYNSRHEPYFKSRSFVNIERGAETEWENTHTTIKRYSTTDYKTHEYEGSQYGDRGPHQRFSPSQDERLFLGNDPYRGRAPYDPYPNEGSYQSGAPNQNGGFDPNGVPHQAEEIFHDASLYQPGGRYQGGNTYLEEAPYENAPPYQNEGQYPDEGSYQGDGEYPSDGVYQEGGVYLEGGAYTGGLYRGGNEAHYRNTAPNSKQLNQAQRPLNRPANSAANTQKFNQQLDHNR